jgi:2'-5' RNA ligase
MYECPGEPEFILYDFNGMTFRSCRAAFAGADRGFVEEMPANSFVGSVEFPSDLLSRILGKKKGSLQNLRRATKTRIVVNEGTGTSHLVVSAESQEKLDNAITQVRSHIDSIRKQQPFTHFVAVPCVSDPSFVEGVRGFLQLANRTTPLSNDAFDNLTRLHITLVTLRIDDDAAANRASQVIKQTVEQFDWTKGRELEISGINTFTSDEGDPRLYFAQLRGTDAKELLRELQANLAADLRSKGFDVVEVTDVFHITILRRSWAGSGPWGSREMLETAAEFRLPPAPLQSVTLCRRFVWKPGQFYYTYGNHDLQSSSEPVSYPCD